MATTDRTRREQAHRPDSAERSCARVLLIANGRFVLLMKVRDPASRDACWIAPGGVTREDESLQDCLVRCVFEVTGFSIPTVDAPVWERHHSFQWNGHRVQHHETFYVVPTNLFNPIPNPSTVPAGMLGFRWWLLDDLRSDERFEPAQLRSLLAHRSGP